MGKQSLPSKISKMSPTVSNVRIKLNFEELLSLWPLAPPKSWCLVNYKDYLTVSDLVRVVIARYCIPKEINPVFSLDSCLLPDPENIEVIRDNDELCVVHHDHKPQGASEVWASGRGQNKRKGSNADTNRSYEVCDSLLKLQDQASSVVIASCPEVWLPVSAPVGESWYDDQQSDMNSRIETDKVDVSRSKTSELTESVSQLGSSKVVTPCRTVEFSCGSSKPTVKSKVVDMGINVKEGESDEPLPKKQKDGDEGEIRLTALELAMKKTLEDFPCASAVSRSANSKNGVSENGAKKSPKRKRRRTRMNKHKQDADKSGNWTVVCKASDSFHSSSFSHTSTPAVLQTSSPAFQWNKTTKLNQNRLVVGKDQMERNTGLKVLNKNARHVTFDDSDNEESVEQSNDVTMEQSSAQSHDIAQMSLSVDFTKSEFQDKQPMEIFEESVRQNRQGVSPNNGSSLRGKSPQVASVSSPGAKPNSPRVQATNSMSQENYVKTFHKGPFTNVKVFNRKRNKKAAFVPLTKEEQLNTMATNKSCILQNADDIFVEVVSSDTAIAQADCDGPVPSKEAVKKLPRDYSLCPVLHGPPQPGDSIAYKVIEMNESYCPALSSYKEAKVLDYESKSQMLELQLTNIPENPERKTGRFDLVIEDDDEILTNTEFNQTQVSVAWTAMVEPRLITEDAPV